MTNITDYTLAHRHSFDSDPFNAVDALVLSSLAYQKMPDIVPTLETSHTTYGSFASRLRAFDIRKPLQSAQSLFRAPFSSVTLADVADALKPEDFDMRTGHAGLLDPKLTEGLYEAIRNNPRFATIRVDGYKDRFSSEQQTQFAALTMRLPDDSLAIVFRGTDDSFVGWKEDFNMAFQYPVPAQHEASEYMRAVAGLWRGPIRVMGHSKGGNLAVYAALNAPDDVRKRVVKVYSLDGPGFPASVVNSEQYRSVMPLIEKIVPDSSIVGMVLQTPEPCRVVVSDETGPMQHLAFSWQTKGNDFVYLPSVSPSSQLFNESLNNWLATMSTEQRERAVDALFEILHSSNADSITELMSMGWKALPNMIGTFVGLSDEDRKYLIEAATLLFNASLARRRNAE